MIKGPNIPRSDIPLIKALLETMQLKEVAEKWEVGHDSLSHFLKRHGLTVHGIRKEFRVKFIKANPNMKTRELANVFNCVVPTARNVINEVNREK